MITILLQICVLWFFSPLADPESSETIVLEKIDEIITVIFTIEAVLKIIATGLIVNGPFSYLRNPWNVLDFLIVTASIFLHLFKTYPSLDTLNKFFRFLKVLRPFRIISKSEGLKVSFVSLLKSVTGIQ